MTRRVLVVGESGQTSDEYDAKSIAALARAAKPSWHIKPLRQPPLLAKSQDREKLRVVAARLAALHQQAGAKHPYDALINHADTDDVEPSHVEPAERIEAQLRAEGCPGHTAVCAWELEGWFFLWPEAIEAARPSAWAVPANLRGRDVGQLRDPKGLLRDRVLRSGKPAGLAYRERDAPLIADQVAPRFAERTGTSKSFDRFLSALDEIDADN